MHKVYVQFLYIHYMYILQGICPIEILLDDREVCFDYSCPAYLQRWAEVPAFFTVVTKTIFTIFSAFYSNFYFPGSFGRNFSFTVCYATT
jgi:hypothetical protein